MLVYEFLFCCPAADLLLPARAVLSWPLTRHVMEVYRLQVPECAVILWYFGSDRSNACKTALAAAAGMQTVRSSSRQEVYDRLCKVSLGCSSSVAWPMAGLFGKFVTAVLVLSGIHMCLCCRSSCAGIACSCS
ncbi:hypothetical protein COO60DRAFT_1151449 [Scenedesmus sp. NREL 46B-D3]|nr:hypothetical protein COO60DRAFT_1151449 [Scenedesmus sp. NREL 46B-D3]